MKNFTYSLVIAAAVLAAGCNVSTEGAEGNILFTPDECGRAGGCDFDDSIGVGGIIHVHIEGAGGFSTAGIDLDSDDPSVLQVDAIADVGGRPTWQLYGAGPGVARLVAYDRDDVEVDFLEVGVQDVTGLTLENFVGDAVGPDSDPNYDEVWTVNAEQPVSFFVTPLIGAGAPTMGVYEYTVLVEEPLADYVTQPDELGTGYLALDDLPAGDYEVSFDNYYGSYLDVLIVAQ